MMRMVRPTSGAMGGNVASKMRPPDAVAVERVSGPKGSRAGLNDGPSAWVQKKTSGYPDMSPQKAHSIRASSNFNAFSPKERSVNRISDYSSKSYHGVTIDKELSKLI